MAKDWAKSFYRSKKWERCRIAYIGSRILEDGGLCEECRDKPGHIVHHKIPLTQDNITNPEITLNFDYLEYVCKDCHDKFEGHGLRKKKEAVCTFDERGQPIPVRRVDRDERQI